jgi:hypothetical protein
MYGTIARFRIKPGMEQRLQEHMKSYESLNVPGFVNTLVYKMDANANEYFMAVVFQDKASYVKNAEDPAQDARYRQFIAFLDGEPEWHDGEIVYQMK